MSQIIPIVGGVLFFWWGGDKMDKSHCAWLLCNIFLKIFLACSQLQECFAGSFISLLFFIDPFFNEIQLKRTECIGHKVSYKNQYFSMNLKVDLYSYNSSTSFFKYFFSRHFHCLEKTIAETTIDAISKILI